MTTPAQETNGLLFAGDLLLAVRNSTTGLFGGFERLAADKFEIKQPADELTKISKGRESFGQAWLTQFVGKPAEFSITLDEVSRSVLAMQLSGEVSEINQSAAALANIAVTVVPGKWSEIGYENLDLSALAVTSNDGLTPYDNNVDYQVNPRTGMIYVPVGGRIAAGTVKLSAGKKAFTGTAIAGGKQVSTDLRIKLDGINLVTRQNMLLTAELATVSAQDAFDFLGGKLASVPLKGKLRIAEGQTAPFVLKYL